MRLKDVQIRFHNELDAIYGSEEVDAFFYRLTDSCYGVSRMELALNNDYKIKDAKLILNSLTLLKAEKPIQYITGETEFFGLPIKVNEHTLIPRPETEELVEWVLKGDRNKTINILDIGTGSGCIAISLAKNLPKANVYALDISKEALKTAKINADLNDVEIDFIEADILSICDTKLDSVSNNFDIIVSNPPYVREKEKPLMKHNVINNEPHLALFVKDEKPLQFYEAITEFAINNLTAKGELFFEINEFLGRKMIQLLIDNNFKNVELKQDIFKKDRMIKAIVN
jgi:release factor glutamine methyltransferase